MQRLARHSTVELTLGRYTHAGLYDLAAAVDNLPALPIAPGDQSNQQIIRSTGMDGSAPKMVAGLVAGPGDKCSSRLITDETKSAVSNGCVAPVPRSENPLQSQGIEKNCEAMSKRRGGDSGDGIPQALDQEQLTAGKPLAGLDLRLVIFGQH